MQISLHSKITGSSPVGTRDLFPFSSKIASTFSNSMPANFLLFNMNLLGTWFSNIGIFSCIASSISHSEAFI